MVYAKALEHATCGIESSRVHYGIGEAYHRKGDFEASIRGFDLALGDVGFPRPTTAPGRLIDTLMNSVYFLALSPVVPATAWRCRRRRPHRSG